MDIDDFFSDLEDLFRVLERVLGTHYRTDSIIKEAFDYGDRISITISLPFINRIEKVYAKDNLIIINTEDMQDALKLRLRDDITIKPKTLSYSFANGILDIEVKKK